MLTKDKMREIRTDRLKLSQEKFGEALGLDRQTIARYEDGVRTIPLATQLAIAWLCLFGTAEPWTDDWRPLK